MFLFAFLKGNPGAVLRHCRTRIPRGILAIHPKEPSQKRAKKCNSLLTIYQLCRSLFLLAEKLKEYTSAGW